MTIKHMLEFEKPIEELENRLDELKTYPPDGKEGSEAYGEEVTRLEEKIEKLLTGIYSNLTAWQTVQVARHPMRPYTLDYIGDVFDDFIELHGDRLFGDDPAIVGGPAIIDGRKVVVIGHQKGRTTKDKLRCNFGMPHPEGYRKALRLMRLAERFSRPVITLIDTAGAYPGIGAEQRGQAGAIATNLMAMSLLKVPIVSVIIGEGGSGGAIALAVSDRVFMFEFSTYSVISPEGCAAILWKDGAKSEVAAGALKPRAADLLKLGVIDGIITEPTGGVHRDRRSASMSLKATLVDALNELGEISTDELLEQRYAKYRSMGVFTEG